MVVHSQSIAAAYIQSRGVDCPVWCTPHPVSDTVYLVCTGLELTEERGTRREIGLSSTAVLFASGPPVQSAEQRHNIYSGKQTVSVQ